MKGGSVVAGVPPWNPGQHKAARSPAPAAPPPPHTHTLTPSSIPTTTNSTPQRHHLHHHSHHHFTPPPQNTHTYTHAHTPKKGSHRAHLQGASTTASRSRLKISPWPSARNSLYSSGDTCGTAGSTGSGGVGGAAEGATSPPSPRPPSFALHAAVARHALAGAGGPGNRRCLVRLSVFIHSKRRKHGKGTGTAQGGGGGWRQEGRHGGKWESGSAPAFGRAA
jgi:hypothetical protein